VTLLFNPGVAWPQAAMFAAVAVSISDCMWRRVGHGLVLSCLAIALGMQLSHGGLQAVGDGLVAAALGGGLMVLAYAAGMVGAADAKVTFAFAAMVGTAGLLPLMGAASLALGVMGVASLAGEQDRWQRITVVLSHMPTGQALHRARKSGQTLPATVALSLGLAVALIKQGS